MQKKQIAHPFHKIMFDYDESKPWTTRDEKLLNIYLELHDHEAKRHEQARELLKQYGDLDRQVEAVRKEQKEMKKKLKSTRETADHILAEVNLKRPNAMERFVQLVNDTNDAIQEYDKKIRELEKVIKELTEKKDKYEEEEEENTLWDRLSELKITYGYDKNLATDYVSFDDDEQRFREKASFISRQNENHMNFCNRVVDNYNKLLLETEIQYEVWTEFGKRMILITQITGRNSGLTEISTN
ncbi:MAG: hypothetical protein SH857_01840 [Chitinophagales bacterium]|nr:hypothetical protein [Chitinophagales bacterium]